MSIQGQGIFDTRAFRIAAIAIAAIAILALAAFLFGSGLKADTSASVAPSPLGSSLTNVRESPAVAPSPLGSSLTNVREAQSAVSFPSEKQSDRYDFMNSPSKGLSSSEAARWATFQANLDKALRDAGER